MGELLVDENVNTADIHAGGRPNAGEERLYYKLLFVQRPNIEIC